MQAEFHLEQQANQSGQLQDSYLVKKTVGVIDAQSDLAPIRTVGLGTLINRQDVQSLIKNGGYLVSIELPATFKLP